MSEDEHAGYLELIPAYALGALDDDEAGKLKRHLTGCAICQSELADYDEVVGFMAMAAPDRRPSSELRERLMTRIERSTGEAAAAVDREQSWVQRMSAALNGLVAGPRWRPAVLVIIVILAVGNVILWRQLNAPDPNSWRRIRLEATEAAPEARGIIYISADGINGTLIVDGLDELEPDQQYQIWLILDGQRTSGAVFSVNSDGYRGVQLESPLHLYEYESFGITVEPTGGSPGPTGERVLASPS